MFLDTAGFADEKVTGNAHVFSSHELFAPYGLALHDFLSSLRVEEQAEGRLKCPL